MWMLYCPAFVYATCGPMKRSGPQLNYLLLGRRVHNLWACCGGGFSSYVLCTFRTITRLAPRLLRVHRKESLTIQLKCPIRFPKGHSPNQRVLKREMKKKQRQAPWRHTERDGYHSVGSQRITSATNMWLLSQFWSQYGGGIMKQRWGTEHNPSRQVSNKKMILANSGACAGEDAVCLRRQYFGTSNVGPKASLYVMKFTTVWKGFYNPNFVTFMKTSPVGNSSITINSFCPSLPRIYKDFNKYLIFISIRNQYWNSTSDSTTPWDLINPLCRKGKQAVSKWQRSIHTNRHHIQKRPQKHNSYLVSETKDLLI